MAFGITMMLATVSARSRQGRALSICLVSLLGIVASIPGVAFAWQASAAPVPPVKGLERFQEWSRLVWAHEPGRSDESAGIVAGWSPSDVQTLRVDLQMLLSLLASGSRGSAIQYAADGRVMPPTAMGRPGAPPRIMKMSDVPDLLRLPRDLFLRRIPDEAVAIFLKRAAMLHTDIVLLSTVAAGPLGQRRAESRTQFAVRIVDGQNTGFDAGPVHWELGRTALGGVRPGPAGDALVSAWYRATSAFMEFRRDYGFAAPHLETGLGIFPGDPYLQFCGGVLHEALAMPMVQVSLQSLPRGLDLNVRAANEELRVAEGFLRRALELDPAMAYARVHFGRVLWLLGRHDAAVAELRRALDSLTDSRQRYYAELFLGSAEEARGRAVEASAAFTRASQLFPSAQSPHLALSQLAWNAGDRAGAQEAFQRLASLPHPMAARDDPWWSYEVSAFRDVGAQIDRLQQIAARELIR